MQYGGKTTAYRRKICGIPITHIPLVITKMSEYVISAFIFGLTAGFKPGPLGIVVIQQTLEHGLKHGLKACLAPIITDGPIIIAALLVLKQFSDKTSFIGILSLVGGLYLLWLSLKIIRIKEINISKNLTNPKSLETAIKVNFLSPNPYLFWFTVGGTYLALGTPCQSVVFIVVSVGTLVVSKMITAWIAAYFRELLDSKVYVWVMRFLGLLLAGFGVLFIVRSQNALFG
jgi:threonine/homoserine/homoserine lactone efflux protein